MKKLTAMIAALCMLISSSACSADTANQIVDDFVENVEDQYEFANGHTLKEDIDGIIDSIVYKDEVILGVIKATPRNYPNITYEEAFNHFFGNPSWEHFTGTLKGFDEDGDGEPDTIKDNVEVVEFTGRCIYAEVEVTALIQFALDDAGETFDPVYCSFNEVPQSEFMMLALINRAFESAAEVHTEPPTSEPQTTVKKTTTAKPATTTTPKAEISLNTPTNVKCTASYTTAYVQPGFEVILTWNKVDSADGYEVYRENFEAGETYTSTETVTECKYTDGTSMPVEYTFKVRAYKNNNGNVIYSDWSEPVYTSTGDHLIPETPTANTPLQSDTGVEVFRCNSYGYINAHGGTVAGYDSSYVLDNGPVATVRQSLGNGWHIVAVLECYSHDTYWYNLYDADDGDYYGWVDADYIDFSYE